MPWRGVYYADDPALDRLLAAQTPLSGRGRAATHGHRSWPGTAPATRRLPAGTMRRLARLGHFLTFRLPDAPDLARRLEAERGVLVDACGGRPRVGFGLYQDEADLGELFRRLEAFG